MSINADTTRERYNYDVPDRLDAIDGVGAGTDYKPEQFTQDNPNHGAGWPTASTRPREQDADHIAHDQDSLVRALDSAEAGDLVFVPGWATITLNGVHEQDVGAENVTLASDRGPLSGGATLEVTDSMYMQDKTVRRVFEITEPGFRLTGLRLVGPQTTYNEWQGYQEDRPMCGLSINADGVEVDNIVGRGWGHTAINCGRNGWIEQPHIHHCDLVDNPQDALGYGVAIRHAKPLIQYNYFDNNRHSVAASGHADCSFVFRHNLVGPTGILHALDMHATDGGGGKRVSAHHNEIMFTANRRNDDPQEAVKFRGVPREGAQVVNNRFHHPSERYDERDCGSDGSAVLLECDDRPDTLPDAGIEVEDNFASKADLTQCLGASSPY